ncbi:hypothetical protein FA13DRAFT_1711520 [Coprinellus micaceus]|uniref:Uncharacterized protein n=1 Tax=Coprinellus micaceus TaxID=71717 RepID=A0A4Y7T3R6_COPMI|nr:hypothetical protein FA13DRAFT_1711520 [Coprinellus micaceus]
MLHATDWCSCITSKSGGAAFIVRFSLAKAFLIHRFHSAHHQGVDPSGTYRVARTSQPPFPMTRIGILQDYGLRQGSSDSFTLRKMYGAIWRIETLTFPVTVYLVGEKRKVITSMISGEVGQIGIPGCLAPPLNSVSAIHFQVEATTRDEGEPHYRVLSAFRPRPSLPPHTAPYTVPATARWGHPSKNYMTCSSVDPAVQVNGYNRVSRLLFYSGSYEPSITGTKGFGSQQTHLMFEAYSISTHSITSDGSVQAFRRRTTTMVAKEPGASPLPSAALFKARVMEYRLKRAQSNFFFSREQCNISNDEVPDEVNRRAMHVTYVWFFYLLAYNLYMKRYSLSKRLSVLRPDEGEDRLFTRSYEYHITPEDNEMPGSQYRLLCRVDVDSNGLTADCAKPLNPDMHIDRRIFDVVVQGTDLSDMEIKFITPWSVMKYCLFMVSTGDDEPFKYSGGMMTSHPDADLSMNYVSRVVTAYLPNQVGQEIQHNPTMVKLTRNAILLNNQLKKTFPDFNITTHIQICFSFNSDIDDFPYFEILKPVTVPTPIATPRPADHQTHLDERPRPRGDYKCRAPVCPSPIPTLASTPPRSPPFPNGQSTKMGRTQGFLRPTGNIAAPQSSTLAALWEQKPPKNRRSTHAILSTVKSHLPNSTNGEAVGLQSQKSSSIQSIPTRSTKLRFAQIEIEGTVSFRHPEDPNTDLQSATLTPPAHLTLQQHNVPLNRTDTWAAADSLLYSETITSKATLIPTAIAGYGDWQCNEYGTMSCPQSTQYSDYASNLPPLDYTNWTQWHGDTHVEDLVGNDYAVAFLAFPVAGLSHHQGDTGSALSPNQTEGQVEAPSWPQSDSSVPSTFPGEGCDWCYAPTAGNDSFGVGAGPTQWQM